MGENKTEDGMRVVIDDDDDEYSFATEPVAGNQKSMLGMNDEEEFSGQNKSSKKNNNYTPETCMNKNKTAQQEDDSDKIATEPPQEGKVDQPQATVADEGGESAAAKKKKKKKEKDKEKKAAGVGLKPDKKVSKSIREIQENLARIKEAEEKKKMEEEERLRKEEEEHLRQQELERIACLKKQREKEKKLKKKQQGKLLTPKQKAEAKRLELMRKQIILGKGSQTIQETPAKRPIYITNKSKQANGKASTSNQGENASADIENMEGVPAVEDKEVDDEWDARCWDDADLKLPDVTASISDEDEPVSIHASLVKKEFSKSSFADKGKPQEAVNAKGGENTLRSPICCIMGHVDAGKTKLLDCIRRTNVQENEAGGITQQIGATYIPVDNIRERTKELKADAKLDVPGLVLIDTPGHEPFNNLRSRGSGLCDIAILVVDIMHGLEPQTVESIKLLRMRNTEFIVALNKVDRLYGWKTCCNLPIGKSLKQQSKDVQREFDHRVTQIITEFKEQGLNTELYYKNKDRGETYSIVPTSAISGEGIPEMLLLLIQWAQKTMVEQLTYTSEIQCKVLEVKVIEGRGTTIDVVLVNGVLHEGDEIVVCGFQGPIHTTIRSLLTPHPMRGAYINHKEIKAAQGIKITAQNLEHAVAGTALYVIGPDDDVEEIKKSVMDDMIRIDRSSEGVFVQASTFGPDNDVEGIKESAVSRIDKSGEGVYVQASTLGSLEALLAFLKTPAVSIPVSGIGLGPVHKKDVMKASVMLEKKKEFATILAFDVKVSPEAQELADDIGVKIFIDDIMYQLFVHFKAYIDNLKEVKKKEAAEDSVFPCVLKIMPNCVFNKKDPIILGVDVKHGILKIGTPICIPQKDFIDIGRISSIESKHNPVDYAKKGQKVAIKITGSNVEEQQKMFGRHFDMKDELVSHISRNSINVLKANYREELSNEEWKLVVQLKRLFKIQ